MRHKEHPELLRFCTADVPLLRDDKGTYILVIKLAKTYRIKPGKLPKTEFRKGMYLYIGRARKALQARLKRHLSSQKKIHWHIDFLLHRARIKEIWIKENFFDECQTARTIKGLFPSAQPAQRGFGSSDCRCPGHLLSLPDSLNELESLRQSILFKIVKQDGNRI